MKKFQELAETNFTKGKYWSIYISTSEKAKISHQMKAKNNPLDFTMIVYPEKMNYLFQCPWILTG